MPCLRTYSSKFLIKYHRKSKKIDFVKSIISDNNTPISEIQVLSAELKFKLFEIYRDYEKHENDLINHRTSWAVTVQSVLIATFGFSLQKYYETFARLIERLDYEQVINSMTNINNNYKMFLLSVSLVGLVVAITAHSSISAATQAQANLRGRWKEVESVIGDVGLPKLSGGGDEVARYHGSTFPRWLSFLFMGLWSIIILGVLTASIVVLPIATS